jgi:hypothetical protein
VTLCHLPVCWNFSSWSKQSYFKYKKWFYTNCGPLRLACFLKLLEPMEIALFQQDFVVAAYLSIEKIVVLRLSTYFLKLLKTIKTTLFQQEFVIPFSCMEIILNQFWPFPVSHQLRPELLPKWMLSILSNLLLTRKVFTFQSCKFLNDKIKLPSAK